MAISLKSRPLRHAALLLVASSLVPVAVAPDAHAQELAADAQAGAQDPLQPGAIAAVTPRRMAPIRASITLQAGSGQVIHLHEGAANVFTADPKVAEVRPASANSLFVFGVAPGTTTVAALTASGDAIAQYQVSVVQSGFDAAQARNAISRGAGGTGVLTRPTETGVSLSGRLGTPSEAERAVAAAKGALPGDAKVDNNTVVNGSIQVGLHVRIAEMTRSLTRELGINWRSAGESLGKAVQFGVSHAPQNLISTVAPNFTANALAAATGVTASQASVTLGRDITAIIDALSQDQLVHVLAEPNLVAMSGQPASFLVGGEFPIPIATENNTISIQFKQYGISLAFVPTVVGPDRISLHVRPEVSQLDKANGVTSILNNTTSISIPALTVRRADTTVELGSGQSFAIAGLLSDQTTQITQATPGLGELPILGALFRSDSFLRQETELVIVVTPYIVRPISDPSALHLPTDGYRPPNDFERILEARQLGRGTYQAFRRMPADAGFIIE